MATHFKKWLAVGTGVGIEIGVEDLFITIARVRPGGVKILATATIARFHERPAAEWGAEYAALLKKHGASHLAAAVLLPRSEMIVRPLTLAGVGDRDLESAIRFQMDSLHPYPEEDAAYAWTRLPGTSTVLIGIARRELIERYATLFVEAGVAVAAFTFSAVALYGALRLLDTPRPRFLVVIEHADSVEVYGESESRPMFTALFDAQETKAAQLAAAELRLPPETLVSELGELLPPPAGAGDARPLSYAAALAGACPRLALSLNLLPPEQRAATSRIRFVPTVALASLLLVVVGALAAHSSYEDRRLLTALDAEITRLEPNIRKAATLDKQTAAAEARVRLLTEFRRRTQADMDALNELTRILPPPAWVNSLEMSRAAVTLSGESDQAAALLKIVDSSPLFANSEFTMPLVRVQTGEIFRIRAMREGALP